MLAVTSVGDVVLVVLPTADCWLSRFGYMFFFFQAEDGIRDLVRSRGLGDVYKRQPQDLLQHNLLKGPEDGRGLGAVDPLPPAGAVLDLSLIHI